MSKFERTFIVGVVTLGTILLGMIVWTIVAVSSSPLPPTITIAEELTRIAAAATPGAEVLPATPPPVEPTLFVAPTETLQTLTANATDTAAPVSPVVAASPTNPPTYVVQSGDTLFTLAIRFGTTVDALKAANGLTSDAIYTGQALVIPGPGAPVSTAAPVPTKTLAPTIVTATSAPGVPTSTVAPTVTVAPATPTTAAVSVGGLGPVVGPSPTWSVFSFPTKAPASGPTKLGFHITLNSGGVLDYVAAVHPPVMKGVEDIGYLKDVKALSPNTITVGRYVVPQENIGGGDPAQRAIDFV
ncbi:MAG: LysM peptidoglycan-binding domain-containing protein, partial [Chloroflexota bacterium]